jgi:hypothetical protein
MSVPLSDRKARVALDTLLISDLRIQFKTKKSLKKEPNTCEVSISNLNEQSRSALQKGRIKVILEAGYPDNIAQVFSGDSRTVDQVLKGATWETKITCGDGERAYRYARVAESFRPGTRVADVVQIVMESLGMPVVGHLAELRAVTEQFLQGYSAFGKVASELDHLLKSRGFTWSIQDGQLQILQSDGTTTAGVIRLAPDTGLIGSPEHGNVEKEAPLSQVTGDAADVGFSLTAKRKTGPAVLKVKSLLQPGLHPGGRVQVESRGVKGLFRIETVTHTGDTFGGEWYSELECLPTSA